MHDNAIPILILIASKELINFYAEATQLPIFITRVRFSNKVSNW